MPLNHEGDPSGIYALILAGIVTALGALWKGWFSFRNDTRSDKRGAAINGGYQDLLNSLRQELKEERDLRHKLEQENVELRRRLRDLEYRLDDGR